MKARFLQLAGLCFVLSAMLFLGACHKKSAPVAPPQAPPPAKPTATLTASPSSLQRGGSVQITWNTQNATDVSIEPIGTVPLNGARTLSPASSVTYVLTAKGPGGSVQETARVTVTEPPPPVAASTGPTDAQLFDRNMKDVYFNYDKYDLTPSDIAVLKTDVEFLAAHPAYKFVISGHCDERGSGEYNLALGSSRANAVRDELVKLGVAGFRIKTISYGKEKPFCTEQNEQCWQQNRRAHFSFGQ